VLVAVQPPPGVIAEQDHRCARSPRIEDREVFAKVTQLAVRRAVRDPDVLPGSSVLGVGSEFVPDVTLQRSADDMDALHHSALLHERSDQL
jgi:hypothetical protein